MGNGRWWEFYFVRYAMGTVTGGAIVSALMRVDPHLHTLLSWNLTELHDSAKLIVLAAYGLVYCYISSIPILVIHAARSLLPLRSRARGPNAVGGWLRRNSIIFVVIFLWLVMEATIVIPLRLLESPTLDTTVAQLGFWLFTLILIVPLLLIVVAIIYRRRCYNFFRSLAAARANQTDAGELITSYRHLREHGNSIFIVALEGVLGLTLFCAFRTSQSLVKTHPDLVLPPQFYLYGIIGCLWILPGILVWFFATLIEFEFIKNNDET